MSTVFLVLYNHTEMQFDSLMIGTQLKLCGHHRLLVQQIILSNGLAQHGSAYSRGITAATLVNRDVRPSLFRGRTCISARLERMASTCLLLTPLLPSYRAM